MSDCKFCALLAAPDLGAQLPNLLIETPTVVAALNRRPAAPGHVTLILKRHHSATSDMRDADWTGVGGLVGRISATLEKRHQATRVVFLGDGKKSAHVHLHLIPEPSTGLALPGIIADLNQAVRTPTLADAEMIAQVQELKRALA
jgi:diadenosine tetraphosphate (Ap4A) HIT family hydrolase